MILAVAVVSILTLGALLLSLIAMFQARVLLQSSQKRCAAFWSQQDTRIEAVQEAIDKLSIDVRQIQMLPQAGPGPLKPGLNLSKRSEALRLHRRGETTEQIASDLSIPPQEVELLIKVHRIVLSKL
jgi:hypothetical protein